MSTVTGGKLIPIDTEKAKALGWIDETGAWALGVNAQQLNANRVFKAGNDWLVLYNAHAEGGAQPLFEDSEVVVRPLTKDHFRQVLEQGSQQWANVSIHRDIRSSDQHNDALSNTIRQRVHADKGFTALESKGEAVPQLVEHVTSNWDTEYPGIQLLNFRQMSPLENVGVRPNGLMHIVLEEGETRQIASVLHRLGVLDTSVELKEFALELKEEPVRQQNTGEQMHPLSQLTELVIHLRDDYPNLPDSLKDALDKGMFGSLEQLADQYKNRKLPKV